MLLRRRRRGVRRRAAEPRRQEAHRRLGRAGWRAQGGGRHAGERRRGRTCLVRRVELHVGKGRHGEGQGPQPKEGAGGESGESGDATTRRKGRWRCERRRAQLCRMSPMAVGTRSGMLRGYTADERPTTVRCVGGAVGDGRAVCETCREAEGPRCPAVAVSRCRGVELLRSRSVEVSSWRSECACCDRLSASKQSQSSAGLCPRARRNAPTAVGPAPEWYWSGAVDT